MPQKVLWSWSDSDQNKAEVTFQTDHKSLSPVNEVVWTECLDVCGSLFYFQEER